MVGITIKTNIESNECDKLGILISVINSIIDYSSTNANNYIELRHYSPYEIFCQITANPECIFYIIGIIYSGLLGVDTLYKKYKEETKAEQEEVMKAGGLAIIGTERHESRRIKNEIDEKKSLAQIELIKAQTEQIKIDNLLKKEQIEKQSSEKIKHSQQIIQANQITINSISHNITAGSILNCDPIFQSYSASNNQ